MTWMSTWTRQTAVERASSSFASSLDEPVSECLVSLEQLAAKDIGQILSQRSLRSPMADSDFDGGNHHLRARSLSALGAESTLAGDIAEEVAQSRRSNRCERCAVQRSPYFVVSAMPRLFSSCPGGVPPI